MSVAAPSSLTAVAVSKSRIDQAWVNGAVYEAIYIERKPSGGAYEQIAIIIGSVTSYQDETCQDGTQYYYKIRGEHLSEYSDYSNEADAITPLPAPTSPSGYAASSESIVFNWNDESQNEANFEVFINGSLAATKGANVVTHTESGLTAGTWYALKVRAKNAAVYSSFSAEVYIYTADPPAAPSGSKFTPTGTTTGNVTWQDNSSNETGFKVERSAISSTAGFSQIGTVGPGVTIYPDTGLTSNKQYWYRIRAYNDSGDSGYSAVATGTTFAAVAQPANLTLTAAKVGGSYGVEAVFDDNSSGEDSHILERGTGTFAGEVLTDGGLENWDTATDLTSWIEGVAGTTTVNRDGAAKHGGSYSCRIDVDASQSLGYIVQIYSLTKGAGYKLIVWYKTEAGKTAALRLVNDGAAAVTLTLNGTWTTSDLWMTLPTATDWTKVEIEFEAHQGYDSYQLVFGGPTVFSSCVSSSIWVDDMSITAGVFGTTVATLDPNRTYVHDPGVSAGSAYRYRVRAKQGAGTYSAYSNEEAITVPAVPAAVADLAVSEYQDEWARLTWTESAGAVGYVIEKSTTSGIAGFAEHTRIVSGISSLKVGGLTASTQYWFRLMAYNGAGDAVAYSDVVTATTRAAYLRSDFDRLLLRANPSIIYLVEANPLLVLSGWSLTTAQTYTYEAAFDELGSAIACVHENGVALTAKTSIATVEATAGTYWHDTASGLVYVHATGGGSPADLHIAASFWLYFTTGQDANYGGNRYLPLVAADGIPDISQESAPIYEGGLSVDSGSVSFVNAYGKRVGGHFFDRIAERYVWLSRKVIVRAGGDGFAYADFVPVNAGTINAVNWSDQAFTLGLRDMRDAAYIDLPEETYSVETFPNMDDSLADQTRLAGYGGFTGAPARRIDATYGVFEFHNGRCKTVSHVYKTGVEITIDTDCFIDYQRGRIVLSAGELAAWTDSDVLTVDFTGWCNTADEAIEKAADIFIDLMTRYLGLGIADLATDEIYATKLAATETLALMVDGNSKDIIRTLERSVGAYSFQDGEGRIGLRVSPTTAPGSVVYAADRHIFSVVSEKAAEAIYSAVVVKYSKAQSTGLWSTATKNISRVGYEHGKQRKLEVETALTSAANALTRAIEIAAELEEKTITIEAQRLMLNLWPADVFYLTRERYPSASGTAANVLMRVVGIGKALGEKRTTITAMEV